MSWGQSRISVVLASASLAALSVSIASAQIPPELIGTWDYESLTALKNGKPFGTVHFRPGQWTLKLNADATWVEKQPPPLSKPGSQPTTGTYEVQGHDLTLKSAEGRERRYRFTLKQHGEILTLTDENKGEGSTISAKRE